MHLLICLLNIKSIYLVENVCQCHKFYEIIPVYNHFIKKALIYSEATVPRCGSELQVLLNRAEQMRNKPLYIALKIDTQPLNILTTLIALTNIEQTTQSRGFRSCQNKKKQRASVLWVNIFLYRIKTVF